MGAGGWPERPRGALSESAGGVRKTALKRAILLGGSIRLSPPTAEILGASEAMVENHYGHLAPDHRREETGFRASFMATTEKWGIAKVFDFIGRPGGT